jgi:hypothetical protein
MDAAAEGRLANSSRLLFVGLEAGMLGALWMLAWMGLSASWQRRSFWMPENLMATAFDGDGPIHTGFVSITISGLALYLLIYSLLGALFAFAVRGRMPRRRVLLWSLAFALAWYCVSFHGIWNSAIPLLARLHPERATVLGHMLYGTVLARYPVYLARWDRPPVSSEAEPPAEAAESKPSA